MIFFTKASKFDIILFKLFRRGFNVHATSEINSFSSLGELKSWHCFVAGRTWRTRDNNTGLVIATEGVLQDTCELRIAVRHMINVLRCQCMNHIAQTWQREINLFRLLECFTYGATFEHLLIPRKVYQIQLAFLLWLF